MIADYGLCHIKKETNSLEELLALLSLNDVEGGIPLHLVHVSRFFWLMPSWLPGPGAFGLGSGPWSGWHSWSWPPWGTPSLAASTMATSHSWSWDLGGSTPATMLWGIVSCHWNNLVAFPITAGDICNVLKSINCLGLWGQIIEVQGFNMPVLSINEVVSGSSGQMLGESGFGGSTHLVELVPGLLPGHGSLVSSWVYIR